MSSTTIWVILGAVVVTALGIVVGVWLSGRGNRKKVKERADQTIQGIHAEIDQSLVDSGLDEEARKKVIESDAVKKEIDEISKNPDKKARLERLAELTNKLMKEE